MNDDDKQAQALGFAYGNLAVSTNHQPSREAFRKLAAEKFGWDDARFDAWAAGRRWAQPVTAGS